MKKSIIVAALALIFQYGVLPALVAAGAAEIADAQTELAAERNAHIDAVIAGK